MFTWKNISYGTDNAYKPAIQLKGNMEKITFLKVNPLPLEDRNKLKLVNILFKSGRRGEDGAWGRFRLVEENKDSVVVYTQSNEITKYPKSLILKVNGCEEKKKKTKKRLIL